MTANVFSSPASGLGSRARAGIAAAVMAMACAAAMALFSAEIALEGTLLARAALPLRMLLLVVLAGALLRWSGADWREVGLRRPLSLGRGAGLVVAGYLAIGVLAALVTQVAAPALGLGQRTSQIFAGLEGNLGEYLYWLLPVAWGSAALGEELVFRGFLQSRLELVAGGGAWAAALALVGQAAVFGALHAYLGAAGALLAGATGLVLGAVYVLGGRNLWACIALHGLVDTVTLTAFYFGAVG